MQSPWNFLSDKSIFECLSPWDMRYLLDLVVYANNVGLCKHMFSLSEAMGLETSV